MEQNFSKPPEGFVRKTIEQPILNSDVRSQINKTQSQEKSFFQANKFYFLAIIFGLAIIAVLAALAFRKAPVAAPKEANVSINIDAPQTLASGSELVYNITVSNNDNAKLVGLNLELVYPDGMQYESSTPKADNLSGTSLSVPDLIPGQNAALFIKTRVTGNVNDVKELLARLHYKYNNFNSEFIKERAIQTRLVASQVAFDLSGQQTANNAQQISYILKYQNNSGSEIQNARIQFNFPPSFNFASASPQPDLGNNIWNISSLPDKGQGVITVTGSFMSASPGESRTLSANFLILGQDGQYFTQNSANFTTAISSLPLSVSQSLENFGNDTSGIVNPGDNVTIKIHYQNTSNIAATGVNIIASLDSKAVDLTTIKAEGAQVNNSSIIWNAAANSQLQSLAPSESGDLSFNFQIKNPATRDSSKNLQVASSIKIKANEYDFLPGNDLTLKISSPAKLSKSLSFDSGSLPPQVGKTSVYLVSLSLSNSSNDFTDSLLTAYIPLGSGGFDASSINASEAGKVEFDSNTGKLTWHIGNLPAYTGKFSQARQLQFKVRLIPSASQVNQSPVLVKNMAFTAKDSFTGAGVNLTAPDVTTYDYQDQNGYNQGQVVQ